MSKPVPHFHQRKLDFYDGKYTLVYEPGFNDRVVGVLRNGEPWMGHSEVTDLPNMVHAAFAELIQLKDPDEKR